MSRLTVVRADGFEDESQARRWLDRASKHEEHRERELEAALRSVNRAIRAHRLAAGDPYVGEVSGAQAREVRLGYGSGDEVVEGLWHSAVVLPPGRRLRRRAVLAPHEELAGILSGRRPAYPSEDLALRARLDLDQARPVQAALQLRAAVDALEAELTAVNEERRKTPPTGVAGGVGDERGAALSAEHARRARELGAAALQGKLDEGQLAGLAETLEEVERALRRRRHHA